MVVESDPDRRDAEREIELYSNYLDKDQAAQYLNISKKVLSRMMNRRLVAFSRIGHKTVRFRRSKLDEAMKRLESETLW